MARECALAATGGVLLAGGRSTRFGAEKAVARIDDRLMMDAVSACFAPLARYAVSARRGSAAERRARELACDILYDDPAHPAGPLAGVAAGLRWAGDHGLRFVATAPCDTPRLPRELFPILLNHLGTAPAAFAVTAEGSNPLCAIWRVEILARLFALLADTHPSVQHFLASVGASAVHFADAGAFANANTQEALAALERRA